MSEPLNPIEQIFIKAPNKSFTAGEVVLYGEEPSGVMCVKKGFIQVYSISDSGDRYIHILYKAGEIFPLIWALHGIRRRIYYEAISDVEITQLSRTVFINSLKKDANLAYEVLSQLTEQFYFFADRLDNLQYKSAHERVAYRLVFLASRFGETDGGLVTIKAPLTHELIGESINLTRETVSREIEELEKKGLITRKQGRIVIKDLAKLGQEFSEPITMDLWGLDT